MAGGPADTIARTIGDKLSISLKQSVVIEIFAPGAGGNTDPKRRKAAADGYTLGHVLSTILTRQPQN